MADIPDEARGPDPAVLRQLRVLVTALTLTMILGIVSIVGLLYARIPRVLPPLPDAIALPGGARPLAVTRGAGWLAVVTDDDRILIYGPAGTLRQEVAVEGDGTASPD